MNTVHKVIFGNSASMQEINSESIQLILTSPPYFNAPFDYKGYYKDYKKYLRIMRMMVKESYRVLEEGRIFALNIDDMLIDSIKYPITADLTRIFIEEGFSFRDRIIWKKPDGYGRISRRSGVLFQNPYPMYFYPDNLLESIIIFQKGKFHYKKIPQNIKEKSKIDINIVKNQKWFFNLWEITNVLPNDKLSKGVAAFPDQLAYRIISLFSYVEETVLDPFLGSGTTMKVSRLLNRNCIGIEILESLELKILEKTGFSSSRQGDLTTFKDEITITKRTKGKFKLTKNYG
ncbi:MAG: site-specific DNA-methyltransferase [Dysgonamonadaceae bacterium]|jgi:site-specific DNA-methyltransferase (adenine-specific)